MIKLSINIMAHPKRKKFVKGIIDKLDGHEYNVIWDRHNSIHDTWERSWRNRDRSADYHLVIQDDAVLCRNFIQRVKNYLSMDEPLYNFHIRKRGDLQKKANEAKGNNFMHTLWAGVAVCIKNDIIDEMIGYCLHVHERTNKRVFDDVAMKRYFDYRKIECCYPLPCLVDHRNERSLIPHMYNGNSLNRLEENGRGAIRFIEDIYYDKTVCIIGSAPTIEEMYQDDKINSYDIVVRINWGFPVIENIANKTGLRTDVLYIYPDVQIEREHKGLHVRLKTLNDHTFDKCSKEANSVGASMKRIDHRLFYGLKEKLGCVPNMGILAIEEILKSHPKELYITGFTFYQGKKPFYDGYRNENKNAVIDSNGDIFGHNQEKQMNYFRDEIMVRENVSVDKFIKKTIFNYTQKHG